MSQPTLRETLPRSARVRTRRAFRKVFGGRCRAADRLVVMYAAMNHSVTAKLGISVGRQWGASVRRNRIKRLVREAFRKIRPQLPQGIDYVVIPRAGPEPTVPELRESIRQLAHRLAERLARG